MNSFTFENVFSKTFKIFGKAFLPVSLITFVLAILLGILLFAFVLVADPIFTVVCLILGVVLVYAHNLLMTKICLNAAFDRPSFDNLFLNANVWLRVFLFWVVIFIVCSIPFALLVIGSSQEIALSGVIAALLWIIIFFLLEFKYVFTSFIIIEKKKGVIGSFKESAKLTQGNKLKIFLLNIVFGIVQSFVLAAILVPVFIIVFFVVGYTASGDAENLNSLVAGLGIGLLVFYFLLVYLTEFSIVALDVSMYKALDDDVNKNKSTASSNRIQPSQSYQN